jgi:hypothetical protein
MGESVGAILDRLQTLLGKGYLLGGLFPMLAGLLLSAPLVWAIEPEAPYWLQGFLETPAARQALYYASLIFLICFLAFILWIMNPWFRTLLENPHIPGLRSAQIRTYLDIEDKLRRLRPEVLTLRLDGPTWIAELRDARGQATTRGTSGPAISGATRAAYDPVLNGRDSGGVISADQLRLLFQQLHTEFRTNTAETVQMLRRMHDEFPGLLEYARTRVEGELNKLTEKKITRFPSSVGMIAPTDLANSALANNYQVYRRYGMNIELFWPLLEKFARGDDKMGAWLEEAKYKLDFSVAMTIVWGVYTSVWVPVLIVGHAALPVYAVVAILGPFITWITYRMCVRNADALYGTMRATAELCRFDLLKALHCPLPADTAEERRLWESLTRLAELGDGTVTYHHPS